MVWGNSAFALAGDSAAPAPNLSDSATGDDAPPANPAPKPEPGAEKFWAAMKSFQSKDPATLAKGRAALDESAASEYTPAQLMLGECYQTGWYGYPQSKKKSTGFFRLAAERGNAFAKVSYGIALFSGSGTSKDFKRAAEWFQAAVASDANFPQPVPPADFSAEQAQSTANDSELAGTLSVDAVASAQARAHYFLGAILDTQKKSDEAQTHYVAAAAGHSGIPEAATQAAINYAFGRGIPRDQTKAAEMLKQARSLGRRNGISMLHNLAHAKVVDDFAVSDLEETIAKAADDETQEAQMTIAREFTDRKSKDYNPKEAVMWFELAAESKKAWAMLELAFLYTRGDLGKPDPEKAFAWFEKAGGGEKPLHYLAVANLVICYQNGIGTAKDTTKALELAKQYHTAEFVSDLTLRNQCPTSILTYDEWFDLNKRWASTQKDAHAQYLMGLRYERGSGVSVDSKDAAAWFKKAAKANYGPAWRELGLLYETRPYVFGLSPDQGNIKAVECYRRGASAKDASATAFLAAMLADGHGAAPDEPEAKRLYEASLAIDPKLRVALNNLGLLYEARYRAALKDQRKVEAELNRTMMIDLFKRADASGEPYAAYNLGRLYYEGIIGTPDFQKAYTYFETAAEHGHREARFRLGEMHEKGEGVDVTFVEAAYHYRLAALDGHVEALRHLVNFYITGKGGAVDFERAQFWLVRLIQLGQVGAVPVMADVAIKQHRYDEAVQLLEWLKDLNEPVLSGFAYERLAICYNEGLGVKLRPERARTYIEKAAGLGNADAIYALGRTKMADGKPAEAVAMFERASEKSSSAAFALAQLYYHGNNVPKDLDKAFEYLRKAADGGYRDALYFLAAVSLTPEPRAPKLNQAIEYARQAEVYGHPKAAALREKLEEKRRHAGKQSDEVTGMTKS